MLADQSGSRVDKYIHDPSGTLIKDPYSIPFQLPVGSNLAICRINQSHSSSSHKKILNHIYKPLFLLKADTRGNVYIGNLYEKLISNEKLCNQTGQ